LKEIPENTGVALKNNNRNAKIPLIFGRKKS
jgi:hypothetical protein